MFQRASCLLIHWKNAFVAVRGGTLFLRICKHSASIIANVVGEWLHRAGCL
jgi:hypothetical protein